MSVWDDVFNDYSGGYSGLDPTQALERWYANRNAVAAKYGYTPEQLQQGGIDTSRMSPQDQAAFSMEQLSQQNPDAFRLLQQGKDRVKQKGTDTRQIFNPTTGEWQTQDVKGLWSHPETWGQLIAGGAFGAAAPAALAGSAAPAAAPVAGEVGTGTLVGGTGSTLGSLGPAGWSGAAGTAAGTGGAAAGGSTLKSLLPYLIGGGVDIAGGYMGSKASKTAAQQQIQSGDRALAALKDAYAQQQAAYNPYAQIGVGALGNLSALTGIQRPAAQPASGAPAPTPQMVSLRAPDGSIQQVPADHVDHYLSLGAQRA
jgi:hypothetical protein